jgi:outer membrane usher protein FimD/PapC
MKSASGVAVAGDGHVCTHQALSTGLGYNLGELGAASADVTQAWSKMKEDEKTSGRGGLGKRRFIDSAIVRAIFTRCDLIFQLILTDHHRLIKQNGYQVYQTYVAPGAFEIADMYPSGGSGDLYVTVEAATSS